MQVYTFHGLFQVLLCLDCSILVYLDDIGVTVRLYSITDFGTVSINYTIKAKCSF